MKLILTDKKVNLPDSIHAYAEKKVGKLDRFFKEDATAAVTFSVEKERNNKVEITVRSSGTIFRVSESTSDMRASIVAAVTTLEPQEQDPPGEAAAPGRFRAGAGRERGVYLRPR